MQTLKMKHADMKKYGQTKYWKSHKPNPFETITKYVWKQNKVWFACMFPATEDATQKSLPEWNFQYFIRFAGAHIAIVTHFVNNKAALNTNKWMQKNGTNMVHICCQSLNHTKFSCFVFSSAVNKRFSQTNNHLILLRHRNRSSYFTRKRTFLISSGWGGMMLVGWFAFHCRHSFYKHLFTYDLATDPLLVLCIIQRYYRAEFRLDFWFT